MKNYFYLHSIRLLFTNLIRKLNTTWSRNQFLSIVLVFFSLPVFGQDVWNYSYTGSVQSITLAPGKYRLEVWGAQGGTGWINGQIDIGYGGSTTGYGGKGGYSKGEITISTTQTIYIYVGGQGGSNAAFSPGGFNGGGSADDIDGDDDDSAGGGGGATDIRLSSNTLADRVIVAGGGGGGGCYSGDGGNGGGLSGTVAPGSNIGASTQSFGYALGLGQNSTTLGNQGGVSGAGGGGYYGGYIYTLAYTVGGNGGSGYVGTLANAQSIDGSTSIPNPDGGTMIGRAGNGYARITNLYSVNITETNSIDCNGDSNAEISALVSGGTSPYTYTWSNNVLNYSGTTATGLSAGTYTITVTDVNNLTTSNSITITQPTALSASLSTNPVVCHGGSDGDVNLTVSGGTASYTYSWSNQATTEDLANVAANTYTVVVTDANGCTATNSATITEPTAIQASISSQTNVACHGMSTGALTTTITGGTANYTYTWSNGTSTANSASLTNSISGLSAGVYTVTVTDANACSASVSETITQSALINISLDSKTNVACNGGSTGSATVSTTGGVSPYTYQWSNQSPTKILAGSTNSNLAAGVYVVTVTDANSCTASYSLTITQPTAISVSATASPVTCNGGTDGDVNLTVSGGTAGYTYSWSNQAETEDLANVTANIYTVVVTDANSCTATTSGTVTQPAAISISTQSQANVSCNGLSDGSVTISTAGGTAPYLYSWSNQQTFSKTPISTTSTNSNLVADIYTVTVTDHHTCTATYSVTITEPDELQLDLSSQTDVNCNGGNNGSITVSATGGTTTYNYEWSHLQPFNKVSNTGSPTAGTLIAGPYTVTVTDSHGCTDTYTTTITEPDLLEVDLSSQTNVNCNGGNNGSITVSVTGGTTTYAYEWSHLQTFNKISNAGSPTAGTLIAGPYTVTVTDSHGCTDTYTTTITEPDVLEVNLSTQTEVSCFGGNNGSITVSVTGGTTAYAYEWSHLQTFNKTLNAGSPTAGTLIAGPYTVTVTDAHGCTDTYTTTITEPDLLEASLSSQTNVSCYGLSDGEASVSVTGGTTSYYYTWSNQTFMFKNPGTGSPTASVLTAGAYTVTVVDAHQCSTTYTVTITEPDMLTASITAQTNVSCWSYSDGNATVTAIGGTTPYAYNWSGGIPIAKLVNSNIAGTMAADDYTVSITDAQGCSTTVDFTITEPDEITADAGTDQQICFDGSVTLAGSYTVAGGAIWSGGTGTFDPNNTTTNAVYTPSADEVEAGTVTLTLITTDNGPCNEASDEMIITIYPEPAIVYDVNGDSYIVGTPLEYCNGTLVEATVSSSKGTLPFSYTRMAKFNNEILYLPNQETAEMLSDLELSMPLTLGTWELIFTAFSDNHGCVTTQATLDAMSPIIQINPNPTAIIESNDPVCMGNEIELSGVHDEIFCTEECEAPQGYCQSYSSIGNYQYISKFKLDRTQNVSGEGTYAANTQSSFKTLYLDSTYNVTITISGPYNYPHYNMIYADWNRDGDFNDEGESYEIGFMEGVGDVMNTLTVPSNAVLGQTVLRVINRKNSYAPACGNYPVGETEDYLIDVKSVDVNSIADYQWSGPAGLYNGKYLTIAASTENDGGAYSLTVTNIFGCSTVTSHDVIVSNPQIDFSTLETNQEAPFAVQLLPGQFDSYSWSDGTSESSLLVNHFGTYAVTVTEYDCMDSESITFNEVQHIALPQGWRMFSTYINQTADIDDVMANVSSSILLVKNNAGQVYWPSMSTNGIHNMAIGQGYQVKMNNAEVLTIAGISVEPENTPISLNPGINLIGMLRHTPVSAVDIFAPVIQSLIYVKLNNGMVYLPQYQVNQVITLQPDDAFKVLMTSPGVITYPSNNDNLPVKENLVLAEPSYFSKPMNTGSNMTLLIPNKELADIMTLGDEIAVYASNGLVAGSAVYEGSTIAMAIWGMDVTQPEKSGLIKSESYEIKIYNYETGRITRFESIEFELGDGTYQENSLAVVKSLNLNLNFNLTIYPNPASEMLKVNFTLSEPDQVRIELFNNIGQLVHAELIEGTKGDQLHIMSLQNLSAGQYTFRLSTQQGIKEQNMLIHK